MEIKFHKDPEHNKTINDLACCFKGFQGKILYWYSTENPYKVYTIVTLAKTPTMIRFLKIVPIGETEWRCYVDREVMVENFKSIKEAVGPEEKWM